MSELNTEHAMTMTDIDNAETIEGGTFPPTPDQIEMLCGSLPLELCSITF